MADFEIRSTSTATPDAPGINTASSNHLTLDNVNTFALRNLFCNGAANIGIMLYGARRGSVSGCRVQGTVRDGIHTTQNSEYVSIVGNQVWNTGDDCIAVVAYHDQAVRPSKISIVGNTVSNIRARGITIEGPVDCTVSGNTVSGTDGYGILLNSIQSIANDVWPTVNCTVVGNTVNNAGQDGIHINGSYTELLVADNVITSPGSAGIRVNRGRVVLSGNLIADSVDQGIFLGFSGSGVDRSIVSNNTVRRSGSQGIYTQGGPVRITIRDNQIEEPNQTTIGQGILVEGGSDHVIVGNRIIATNSTRTTVAVVLFQSAGAVVENNYHSNAGSLFVNDNSTGVTSGHTHGVTDFTATGTRNSTTFLRGDNTWAAPTAAAPSNMLTTDTAQTLTGAGIKTFPAGTLLMNNGAVTAEPYSDANPPQTLNISTVGATTVPNPPSGQSTLYSRDGTGLRMKNASGQEFPINVTGAVTLTDAASITTDASLGTRYRVTVAGDRTFAAPTNAMDGMRILYEITASGANRTVTFATGAAGAFAYGSDFTSIPVITSGTTTFVGATYSSRSSRWHILAVGGGHA